MSTIEKLWTRIKNTNLRAHSCDNVSQVFNSDEEKQEYIEELAFRFENVLQGLLIDTSTDPNAHGTAKRLAKMYVNELMEGRFTPEPDVTSFPNDGENSYKGMLVVRAELKSMCSHHHQPVTGTAYIGVLPGKNVIGLSKYVRIAQWCARRGTLQEELTTHICDRIQEATESKHVAVYIQAQHGCCTNRGVMAHSSLTQTSVLRGDFLTDGDVKSEFFANVKMQQRHRVE